MQGLPDLAADTCINWNSSDVECDFSTCGRSLSSSVDRWGRKTNGHTIETSYGPCTSCDCPGGAACAVAVEDVAYTYNWIVDPESESHASGIIGRWLERAEVTGPNTVRFHLKSVRAAAVDHFS